MSATASHPECIFEGDKFERYLCKCIIFPADGSPTEAELMVVETTTITMDNTSLRLYSRCIDLNSTFGAEHRDAQTRATPLSVSLTSGEHAYLLFYNCSLRLPVNLNIAGLVGISSSYLKTKKRLFWRGDVVAMKIRRVPPPYEYARVEPLDADLSTLWALEEAFRVKHQEGFLEQELYYEEMKWKSYIEKFGVLPEPLRKQKTGWVGGIAEMEENRFTVINEQRSAIGRAPLLRAPFMRRPSASNNIPVSLPKLPPELELQIFETCARAFPEVCRTLVLVSKSVYAWIDPILISTVCLIHEMTFGEKTKLESLLDKLSSGKHPAEYYARHVKNLAFFGDHYKPREVEGILAICTGVENLLVDVRNRKFAFFDKLLASTALRRLYIHIDSTTSGSTTPQRFNHTCFRNLTHLHFADSFGEWIHYTGWEHLQCLTHLAFVLCHSPDKLHTVLKALPAIRYVAHGAYQWHGERYGCADVVVNKDPHMRELYGARVVFLDRIPLCNWEQGARGEGDFWDIVEDEVEKCLRDVSN